VNRAHLAEEILQLEKKLNQEQATKQREEQEFQVALEAALKNANRGAAIPSRSKNDCDICSLNWPRFFGEICLLDPEGSINLGTVIADSSCEIFLIHKYQLQTFRVGNGLIDQLKVRSIKYPSDTDLIKTIDRQKDWTKYRSKIMDKIPKGRWPSKEVEYEQMVFSNHTNV
jgi:hypothetical protein